VPFNIASYALLTLMVAQATELSPESSFIPGRCSYYLNHIHQVKLQLTREPYRLPKITINPAVSDITKFRYEDFTLSIILPILI